MRTIMIIGSIEDESQRESLEQLGSSLGQAIIENGHIALNGGTDLPLHVDKYVANGAKEICDIKNYQESERIIAVVRKGGTPHGIGKILSASGDTENEKRMGLIQKADAIIVVGGSSGTKEYLALAEMVKKPIIPVPILEGAAQEYWNRYSKGLPDYLPDFLKTEDFEDLNQVVQSDKTINDIAEVAVDLAKKTFAESNYIFIAMPFGKKYNNTLRAIERAIDMVNDEVDEVQYVCERIDKAQDVMKINEEIEKRIKKAKIIIADLSESSANVHYELGLARGQGITAIPIAEEGTELLFDNQNFRTEFYDLVDPDINSLEKKIEDFAIKLKDRIKAVEMAVNGATSD